MDPLFSVDLPAGHHYALMEFVRADSPQQLLENAGALCGMMGLKKPVSGFCLCFSSVQVAWVAVLPSCHRP